MGVILSIVLALYFAFQMGNGCTSGHGVCGLARCSPRSVAATLCFLSVGVLTASLVRLDREMSDLSASI